jgi:hypothetical protein
MWVVQLCCLSWPGIYSVLLFGRNWPYVQAGEVVMPQSVSVIVLDAVSLLANV